MARRVLLQRNGRRADSMQGEAAADGQAPPPQPAFRTEKDIGSENPETTTVSGFFCAFFQGAIQKISFPKNDLWGGLELFFQISWAEITIEFVISALFNS